MNPPKNNSEFDHAKEVFWKKIADSTIPPDLQNLYRDSLNSMRAGFNEGIRFCMENKKFL